MRVDKNGIVLLFDAIENAVSCLAWMLQRPSDLQAYPLFLIEWHDVLARVNILYLEIDRHIDLGREWDRIQQTCSKQPMGTAQ